MLPVLVLNAGSSTIKYPLDGGDRVLASGLVERIGEDGARLVHRPADGETRVVERPVARPRRRLPAGVRRARASGGGAVAEWTWQV